MMTPLTDRPGGDLARARRDRHHHLAMRLADIQAAATGALRLFTERPGDLRLVGELDMCTRGQLLAAAAGQIGTVELRVDVSGVTFVDCSGLAALVRIAHATRAAGGEFTITASSPALARLSTLAGTDDILGLPAPAR
jgi:anti-sigma B factor antagonist